MINIAELGVAGIENNPDFNFLHKFSQEIDDDSILQSGMYESSPYSEIAISCNYSDNDQIPTAFKNNFSVITLNIQSLQAKFNDLLEWIGELGNNGWLPDLICLQEIWQIADPSLFSLPNYHPLITKMRTLNRGGGVGIYIKKNIAFRVLEQYSLFSERLLEALVVEVTMQDGYRATVGSIYRPGTLPPGKTFTQQFADFSDTFSRLLSEMGDNGGSVYLYGDLNLDVLRCSENRFISDCIETLLSYGFLQIVTKPTRIGSESATVIDHIITNDISCCETLILCNALSDHFPVAHFLNVPNPSPAPKYVGARDFSDSAINRFRQALINYSWNNVLEIGEAQTAFDAFYENFIELFNLYFPISQKKINPKYNKIQPWYTLGLLTSRKTKIKLNQKFRRNPTPANKLKSCNFRNIYNKLVREAKKMHFQAKLAEHSNNLKKTWQIVYNAIRKTASKGPGCVSLLVNNQQINDPRVIAESFNHFFINAAQQIVNKLHPTSKSPLDNIPQNPSSFSLTNIPVTLAEVQETIKLLLNKKTPDLNGISSYFIKKIDEVILVPLHHVIRLSFESGYFPNQLKIAKVVPVFKSGDRLSMDNYRPISLLPTLSKIFEKIVANRLMQFLNQNSILSQWQFGFRPRHSTLHPMVHFVNHISEALNKKHHAIAIFCDLRKAFDTCDHEILCKKLQRYGVGGTELAWFRSYLSDRQQFVHVDGVDSSLLNIILGVPQGSILGPLLFLIYINDLPLASTFLSLLFADDTTLLLTANNLQDLENLANRQFYLICEFFRTNKLALHPNKTNYIVFTNSKDNENFNLFCNNNNENENNQERIHEINRIQADGSAKFLGVLFDPQLNFKTHTNAVKSKLAKALYSLRMAKNLLPTSSLILLYQSLFHCHLIYALPIWQAAAGGVINEIFKMQKNAIRIITGSKYNAHTEPLFKKLEILPFPDLINFFKLQFMHRFIYNHLPSSFANTWIFNRDRAELGYVLRNEDDLHVPFSRLALTERLPLAAFPRIWNEFTDPNIKNIASKANFDNQLKLFFLNDLSENVVCNRLYCPACSGGGN